MKNIAIIPNIHKDAELFVTKNLVEKLLYFGAEVFVEAKFAKHLSQSVVSYDTFPEDAELIIVVGGDGSILDASVIAIERNIPILGVNLGKVGYLSEVEPDNLDILSGIFFGNYSIEEKMLLSVNHVSDKVVHKSKRLAVNDVIISHDTFLGIADFVLENSVGDCLKYRADGLILSTPAGSTAYSLSAGGPIVSHDIDSIVATPICPHSFFNRSIIFKPDEELSVTNNGGDILNVTVDGRFFTKLLPGGVCKVRMAKKRFKMVTFNDNNMVQTLFEKMKRFEKI